MEGAVEMVMCFIHSILILLNVIVMQSENHVYLLSFHYIWHI